VPAKHARHEVALVMLEFLETGWQRPDEGIMGGPRSAASFRALKNDGMGRG
jgi:hypothetical protein